jgi:[methyl-Co(III) methanol-specific corrinoid protein]:coenzyme M methyltransferase
VTNALLRLSSLLATIGMAYKEAGADFTTIHEMGGSPGFIGRTKFEQFVLPALRELTQKLNPPCVLSICGKTNPSMDLLAQSGAAAISVDQTNDLTASRASLKGTLLFGNIDPVQTLWQGDEQSITEAARLAGQSGVDALWPGCDLVPQTPITNIFAFLHSLES